VVRALTPQVPEVARTPCDAPATLPDRAMTAREVASVMARDGAALRQCEVKRAAAVAAIDEASGPGDPGADETGQRPTGGE
jgi:hypothetical protein